MYAHVNHKNVWLHFNQIYINSYSFNTSNYREVMIGQITLNTVYILHVCACVLIKKIQMSKKRSADHSGQRKNPKYPWIIERKNLFHSGTYIRTNIIIVLSLPAVFK